MQPNKKEQTMTKFLILGAAVLLTGCYGYSTTHTLRSGDLECQYTVTKRGNAMFGYSEINFSNEKRSEQYCRTFLRN